MLAAVILFLTTAAFAQTSPEGIEVTSFSIEEGTWGLIASGEIINHGPHTIEDTWVEIAFLKNSKVLGEAEIQFNPPTIHPGKTAWFEQEVNPPGFEESDQYIYRVQGEYEEIPSHFTRIEELEDLPGIIEVIEGSQTTRYDSLYKSHSFHGQIVNNTPAFIGGVGVKINIYDTDGDLVAKDSESITNLHPSERAAYSLHTNNIRPQDLGHYEITLEPRALYLLPTSVDADSWGIIKKGLTK